jgi:transposase
VHQVEVPWAAPGSRFTLLFEGLVILWLQEASHQAVARLMDLTWDQVDGIQARAVRRGLRRREPVHPTRIGVDEKSFKKRHDYVTVITDLVSKKVLHVADGRKKETLTSYYASLGKEGRRKLEVVAMDMYPAYITATQEALPSAQRKIAFDRFHVVRHLLDAVDRVRRQENRVLRKEGDDTLVGTKWLWLQNPLYMSDRSWERLDELRERSLKTARAWAIQESATALWDPGPAKRVRALWERWIHWPLRCRLEPVVKVARMIKSHLYGIVNAIVHRATNATSEGINSVIQKLKGRAHGYRNRQRFRNAIYFHLAGLDLMPRAGEP